MSVRDHHAEVQATVEAGDEIAAGRHYLELRHAEEHGAHGERGQAAGARETLERHFPRAAEIARHETSEELGGGPHLPRHLAQQQRREREAVGMTAAGAKREREERRRADDQPREPARRGGAAGGAGRKGSSSRAGGRSGAGAAGTARRVARGAWRESAFGGTGSNVGLQAAGAFLTLSIAYLLLNERGAGPKALQGLLGGLGRSVEIFLGPFDPLNPSGAKAPKLPAASIVGPHPDVGTTAALSDPGVTGFGPTTTDVVRQEVDLARSGVRPARTASGARHQVNRLGPRLPTVSSLFGVQSRRPGAPFPAVIP